MNPFARCGLAAALLVLGCGASRGPETGRPTEPIRPEPTPAPSAAPGPPARELDDNAEAVARALARVARLRALAPKGAVQSRTMPRPELIDLLKDHIAEEVPEAVIVGLTELLVGLGVVPVSFDYEQAILSFMNSEIAGLYVPENETMYLAEDLDAQSREQTLLHELVHALQDQHYDLDRHLNYAKDRTDAQTAVHALAEGDATSLMLDAALEPRGATALDAPESLLRTQLLASVEVSGALEDVPPIIRRSVVSSYIDGIDFVHGLRRKGGWRAVDAAWRDPPTTTEQLLHPEKYAAREAAEEVVVPPPPAGSPGWEPVYVDTGGELSIRLFFEEWVPERTAHEASAGWGGDRVAVYQDAKGFAVAYVVRWDDEASAKRGHETFARGVLAPKSVDSKGVARAAMAAGTPCRERADRGPLAAHRSGRTVVVIAGPYDRRGATVSGRGNCVTARRWVRQIATAVDG